MPRNARGTRPVLGTAELTSARLAQVALAATLVVALMTAVTVVTAVSGKIPDAGFVTRDPTSVGDLPWYAGSVSRITNLAWASAATLCLVAAITAAPPLRRLLLLLGVLVTVLTLDDTLQLHDAVLPARGIPEGLVLTGYVVGGGALALLWLPERRRAVGAAFYLGGALLAVSVVIDAVLEEAYVPEDGFKLIGLLVWALGAWWAFTDGLADLRRRAALRAQDDPPEPGTHSGARPT